MATKGGLGKGLEALFPSNVDIGSLSKDVSRETSGLAFFDENQRFT